MIDEFAEEINKEINKLWEETKKPLERIWDGLFGYSDWDFDQLNDRTFYRLPSINDVDWCGSTILIGHEFPCHLCGIKDEWVAEGSIDEDGIFHVRVFVHEHEPIWAGSGSIRQVSTVSPRLVDMHHITGTTRRSKKDFYE